MFLDDVRVRVRESSNSVSMKLLLSPVPPADCTSLHAAAHRTDTTPAAAAAAHHNHGPVGPVVGSRMAYLSQADRGVTQQPLHTMLGYAHTHTHTRYHHDGHDGDNHTRLSCKYACCCKQFIDEDKDGDEDEVKIRYRWGYTCCKQQIHGSSSAIRGWEMIR